MAFLYGIAILAVGCVIGFTYCGFVMGKIVMSGKALDLNIDGKKKPHRLVDLTMDNLKNTFIMEMSLVFQAGGEDNESLFDDRLSTALHTYRKLCDTAAQMEQ